MYLLAQPKQNMLFLSYHAISINKILSPLQATTVTVGGRRQPSGAEGLALLWSLWSLGWRGRRRPTAPAAPASSAGGRRLILDKSGTVNSSANKQDEVF